MKLQCNSCGGTYEDTTTNGCAYLHACSPEIITTFAVETAGIITKAEVRAPRPNPRDENPKTDANGKVIGIKAAGAGTTQI